MVNRATNHIQELYADYQQFYFTAYTNLNQKERKEVIITSLRSEFLSPSAR
jgi:hypothetical protein